MPHVCTSTSANRWYSRETYGQCCVDKLAVEERRKQTGGTKRVQRIFKESLKHRCKQIYCVGPAVGTIMVWTVVPASWSRNCPLGCRRPSCPATVSRHFRLFWPHPNVLVQILQIHRPLPTRPPMFFSVLWSRWGWKSMRLTKKKKSQWRINPILKTNTKKESIQRFWWCDTVQKSRS